MEASSIRLLDESGNRGRLDLYGLMLSPVRHTTWVHRATPLSGHTTASAAIWGLSLSCAFADLDLAMLRIDSGDMDAATASCSLIYEVHGRHLSKIYIYL